MTSHLPPVSVIIPCFNAEKYIEGAIRSVLLQDWPHVEIIVVDDGSTDRSADIVQKTFPQVTLVKQANQGVSMARNSGIQATHGDWIAFLDADDLWLPEKLASQWSAIQANPGTRMCYTAWQTWQSEDPTPSDSVLSELKMHAGNATRWRGASGWIYSDLLLDCVVWTSTVLVQRTLLDEIGYFDPNLKVGEDYDLWLRASQVAQILRVSRPFALYRSHVASITKSAPKENYQGLVVQRAIERWGIQAPGGKQANRHDVNCALARTWSNYAGTVLEEGRSGQAWHAAMTSLKITIVQTAAWKILVKAALLRIYELPKRER